MPRGILTIAAALQKMYESVYNLKDETSDLTEMKMHKLLYFAQKRHYENFGEWLFNDDFEGWVHGPVNRNVRVAFFSLNKYEEVLTLEEVYTLREIVYEFGKFSAGYLRNLSHNDPAYKISRAGLRDDERGDRVILKENIIIDIPSYDGEVFDADGFDGEVH